MAAPNRVLDAFHKLIGGGLIALTVGAAGAFGYAVKSFFFDRPLHLAQVAAEQRMAAAAAAAAAEPVAADAGALAAGAAAPASASAPLR